MAALPLSDKCSGAAPNTTFTPGTASTGEITLVGTSDQLTPCGKVPNVGMLFSPCCFVFYINGRRSLFLGAEPCLDCPIQSCKFAALAAHVVRVIKVEFAAHCACLRYWHNKLGNGRTVFYCQLERWM